MSLNTVRTHTKNLYLKLGVNSRRAALSRARPSSALLSAAGRVSPPRSPPVVKPDHHVGSYAVMNTPRDAGSGHEDDWYQIRIQGHLDQRWASWFDGLTLTHDEDGTTLLQGHVADQAALHGLLTKVRDMGLPLVSVTRASAAPSHPRQRRRRRGSG